jgi:hypothetical protein
MPNGDGSKGSPFQVSFGYQGPGWYYWPAFGNATMYAATFNDLNNYQINQLGAGPVSYAVGSAAAAVSSSVGGLQNVPTPAPNAIVNIPTSVTDAIDIATTPKPLQTAAQPAPYIVKTPTANDLKSIIKAAADKVALTAGTTPQTQVKVPGALGSIEAWVQANPAIAAALGLTAVVGTAAAVTTVLHKRSTMSTRKHSYIRKRAVRKSTRARHEVRNKHHHKLKFGSAAYRKKYLGHK